MKSIGCIKGHNVNDMVSYVVFYNDRSWNEKSSGGCFVDLVAEHGKDDPSVLH